MRINTAVCAGRNAMQVFEQLFARERLTRMAGEQVQEFKFVRGEFERSAVECHGIFFRVNLKLAYADNTRRFDVAARSP